MRVCMHIPLIVSHMGQLFLSEIYTRMCACGCTSARMYVLCLSHDRNARTNEISACPRKTVVGCIICMIDDIVLPVNERFLSHNVVIYLSWALPKCLC